MTRRKKWASARYCEGAVLRGAGTQEAKLLAQLEGDMSEEMEEYYKVHARVSW